MQQSSKQLPLFALNQTADEKNLPHLSGNPGVNDLPETYTGLYAMHKYWSKKPADLVAKYIERYSQPGDIVLDSFCGSGVTVIESVRLNRRAIGIDINPIAIFSTRMALEHVDINMLKACFESIKRDLENDINRLYYTECPICSDPHAVTTHTIWENEQPIELWMECHKCKTSKAIKVPTEEDRKLLFSSINPTTWYPTTTLIENARINAKAGMRVCDLFTNRALYSLSLILDKIRQVQDEKIRSTLEFCFSATLPQASNMVFVIRRRGKTNGKDEKSKAEVGSWVIGYWIPNEHFEIHPLRCFENRLKRILRGKEEVNKAIPLNEVESMSFSDLVNINQGYFLNIGTATNLPLPSDSIDYVFTDPPHGNRIPYLELSLMWNSWLKFDFDWDEEIIISEARSRKKNLRDYNERLKTALTEIWRVLKSDKFLSIAFNSLDDDTWFSLLDNVLSAGFIVIAISPLEYSARSVVQDTRKNALKTDFVITCQKKVSANIPKLKVLDSQVTLQRSLDDYLTSLSDGAATYEILNYLLIANIPRGQIFKISSVIDCLNQICIYSDGRWRLK
ncbi:MAG: DNA methyltransferase [Anaerolineales bacterium]|nr:DNA methyltransferase [Anaerolineales bacterium]